jgi:hypothetical protein
LSTTSATETSSSKDRYLMYLSKPSAMVNPRL